MEDTLLESCPQLLIIGSFHLQFTTRGGLILNLPKDIQRDTRTLYHILMKSLVLHTVSNLFLRGHTITLMRGLLLLSLIVVCQIMVTMMGLASSLLLEATMKTILAQEHNLHHHIMGAIWVQEYSHPTNLPCNMYALKEFRRKTVKESGICM
ncbi:FRIGIDA-like protein 3 [Iris pallida]|uniref:FRIGIDA-like protein 3 n=1 Tax=Iris pallida TaxID=29817 RepID=A0AAX6HFE8_IRIPA|nr:FRIGIDA-like protein 3 [Iris pallida]